MTYVILGLLSTPPILDTRHARHVDYHQMLAYLRPSFNVFFWLDDATGTG
jgi:hypothetical protein